MQVVLNACKDAKAIACSRRIMYMSLHTDAFGSLQQIFRLYYATLLDISASFIGVGNRITKVMNNTTATVIPALVFFIAFVSPTLSTEKDSAGSFECELTYRRGLIYRTYHRANSHFVREVA